MLLVRLLRNANASVAPPLVSARHKYGEHEHAKDEEPKDPDPEFDQLSQAANDHWVTCTPSGLMVRLSASFGRDRSG